MQRFQVKDLGVYEPARFRVIDARATGEAATILRTNSRAVADGLAADYNDRYDPPWHVRLARRFGLLLPAPVQVAPPPVEAEWQRRIRHINEMIERRKKAKQEAA